MKSGIASLLAIVLAAPVAAAQEVVALRVGRAETIANGTIEHAVILVEHGVITAVGQDLPIERGIPTIDLTELVVMPGLVNCRTRIGLDSRGGSGADIAARASAELYADQEVWARVLEKGVTTLGIYPAGTGIPGLAAAIRPSGDSAAAMTVKDPAYLQMYLRAERSSKKLFTDAFDKLDKYLEKVAKDREKHEKDSKDSKDKKDAKPFQPPQPDEDVRPILDLVTGRLRAVIGIRKAADWLHLLDVIGKREFEFDLQCDLRDDLDLFYVKEAIGERKLRVIFDPRIVAHPGTRRDRNFAAEFVAAGAKLALSPRADSVEAHEEWLSQVGELVRFGLDRQAALRAVTLEPAHVLGIGDQLGSIEVGRKANLIFFDGDPFDPSRRLQGVMLEGRFVAGERFVGKSSTARVLGL
jgi:hypothetical protein